MLLLNKKATIYDKKVRRSMLKFSHFGGHLKFLVHNLDNITSDSERARILHKVDFFQLDCFKFKFCIDDKPIDCVMFVSEFMSSERSSATKRNCRFAQKLIIVIFTCF